MLHKRFLNRETQGVFRKRGMEEKNLEQSQNRPK